MKMGKSKQVHYDSGPNMTPLVDVVMVILIFLMLTGTFTGATTFLRSNMPMSETGPAAPGKDDPLAKTKVDVWIDGPKNYRIGGRKIQGDDALKKALLDKRQDYTTEGKKDSDIQVTIYPLNRILYQDIVIAYGAALEAKFPKIAFAKVREQ